MTAMRRISEGPSRIYSCLGILILVLMGFPLTGTYAEMADRIVAVVNEEVVLYSEVKKRIDQLKKKGEAGSSLRDLEKVVLDQIIQEKLLEQEMKRLKISVSEENVKRAIESIKKEQNLTDEQFQYFLEQEGLTFEQFKENISKELERAALIEKVFKSKTVITDADVERYIKANPEMTVEKIKISAIYLPKDQKTPSGGELVKKIKGGADFADMAKKYSKGPNASEGGSLGWMNLNELSGSLRGVVMHMQPGEVSSPISSSKGEIIIKLEDKSVEKVRLDGLSIKDREKIRHFLLQKEIDKKFQEWMGELVKRSYIKISL